MQIKYYGHACMEIICGSNHLLVDPFITPNPKASGIKLSNISASYILITHGHHDHLADAEALAKQNDATIISTYEIANWFEKKGVENVMGMNIGGNIKIDDVHIYMTSALHSSSLPDGSYGGSPAGFVVSYLNKNCYMAGDTGLSMEMELLARKFKLDVSFLPIGDRYTMDYKDALIASKMLQTNLTVGTHYNTFEALQINVADATAYFKQNNQLLTLLEVGESIVI